MVAVRGSGGDSVLATAAAGLPGVESLAVLVGVDPSSLSPSDLVDAVICAERLLAHVNFLQAGLLAELGRPNRCGDVSGVVAALVDKAGAGRGADGSVDEVVVAELTADRSIGVAATEVAAVLDWSPITARIRINQAQRLESALPQTLAALRAGRVDVGRVRMIVDRTAVLSPPVCRQIEPRILTWVKGRSKGQLETLVDREVIAADPDAAENRRIKALKDRSVSHRVDRDGMGVINALLPAEAAVMVFTLVDLIADANKGLDGRSVDQRRADAIADIADELLTHGFVDLHGLIATVNRATSDNVNTTAVPDVTHAEGADAADVAAAGGSSATETGVDCSAPDEAASNGSAPDAAVPTDPELAGRSQGAANPAEVSDADRSRRLGRAMSRHGRRPHLNITGAWTTIAGLDDLPGHLDGHGTITAQLLRAIAQSWGSLTAVGVNPVTGTATAVGATTYRPSQVLCDQVALLSGTCRMPGCSMPAWKCDIDHLLPFDHQDPATGGQTTLCNTYPFCKFHHLLKHHTGWTPHLQADLSLVWTTNTGHQATSHPRQFTVPGEWDRPPPEAPGEQSAPTPEVPPSDRESRTKPVGATPTIIGPTVAGPTIPVLPPGGPAWVEPHTELEDPGTIPHPGSVEINSYRILRRSARDHSLRRLAGLRQYFDPAEQRTRDFINGRTHDTDGNPLHPDDFDAATREKARITESLAIAALLERSRRPSTTVQSPDGRLPSPGKAPETMSDEAPF